MKLGLIICAAALWCVAPVKAADLGAFASYWDPSDADDTYGGGAVLRFDFSQNLMMDVRISHYEFVDRLNDVRRSLKVTPLEAGVTLDLLSDPQLAVYVGGGIGYYLADGDISAGATRADLDISNSAGYFALGGFRVRLSPKLRFFGEAKYTWLEYDAPTSKDTRRPMPGGDLFAGDLDMEGIGINVGFLYRF